MRKILKASIFSRLVLASSLALLLLYCAMVYLIISNTNASRDVFLESRRTQGRTYVENLGRQLDIFRAQQGQLIHDQAVRKLAYGLYDSNYEKYQYVLSLMRRVTDIAALSPLIDDVIVQLPSQDIQVSVSQGYAAKAFTMDLDSSEQGALSVSGRDLVMQMYYPLNYSHSDAYVPDMVLSVVFDELAIRGSLRVFTDDLGSGAALVFGDKLALGNVSEAIIGAGRARDGNAWRQAIAVERETYHISTFAIPGHALELLLAINNSALTRLIARDIALLTVLTVAVALIFFLFLLFVRSRIHKPLNKLVEAFKELQQGSFETRIFHKADDEFNYLFSAFNQTVEELRRSIDKTLEQERLINQAELAQLQSQIKPHFLYNSFFSISRMARNEEHKQIYDFVTSLARYYRFVSQTPRSLIPLKDEAAHMNNYLDIQQLRFGDMISVHKQEVPEDVALIPVPKLILQPLIENAYEHGLKDKQAGGKIRITYACEKSHFDIVVEDSGSVSDETIERARERLDSAEDEARSHALCNIHQRLRLTYGADSGLLLERSPLGGLKVRLRVTIGSEASRND